MKILSFDVGIINLAYCIIETGEINPESFKIIHGESFPKILYWEIINNEISNFNAKISSSSVSDLYINLIKNLDHRKHLLDVDIVLIEKQPSFNPKMRIIAGCLQTYFYIRGVVDRNSIQSVEFFSPKNKLKCYSGPELDISSKNGKIVKGKYAQTKKMGVAIAKVKLEEYSESEWLKVFENSKKKDDLSDCYLQALTYLMFKKVNVKSARNKETFVKVSKANLKKQLKEHLDKSLKNCSVIELMEKKFRSIHELEFPFELPESIEILLSKLSLKKYMNLKYL